MIPIEGPPTAPADCVLAFAIPTTGADIVRDLALGPAKDFASHVVGRKPTFSDSQRWELYEISGYKHVVPVIDEVTAAVQQWKVRAVRDLTFHDLRPLLRSEDNKVITLVTHSSGPGDQVEFSDGLRSLDEVVAQVPVRPGAILDLTICYSTVLADAIKWKHPEWQVRSNEEQAPLKFGLLFYKHKIKRLTLSPINYLDADLALRLALARGERG
jgi:hypothetical protein